MNAFSELGPQDGDLGVEDAEEAEVEAPANGTHPQAPDIKISFPKGKAKKAIVEGQAELDALAALGGSAVQKGFTVECLAAPEGWPDDSVAKGILAIKLKADDLEPEPLIRRLGGGTFRLSSGKVSRTLTLVGAPKNHGPAKPAEPESTWVWIQGPEGMRPVQLPKGVPPPPPSMGMGAWGAGGWGQPRPPEPQDLAKAVAQAVAETMKPILELLKGKEDGGSGKIMLEIEKMKLEQAKEESKARAAEAKAKADSEVAAAKARADADVAAAKEQRLQRDSELKHQSEMEGRRLEKQAEAQVKSAEAMAKAQTEMAQASVKAAEARAKSEEGAVDRFFKWQEKLAPRESPWEEHMKMFKAFQGIAGGGTLATIFDGLPKVVSALGHEVRSLAASLPTGAPAAGAPAPAQVTGPPPELPAATKAEIEEFMSVVRTASTALKEKRDAAATANLLAPAAPKVMALLAATPPDQLAAVLGKKISDLVAAPEAYVAASAKAALTEAQGRFASAEGQAWLGQFYVAVMALMSGGKS